MKTSLRFMFFTILGVFVLSVPSYAQLLKCDKLHELVKAIAQDSTLNSIKGPAWDDVGNDCDARISLWYQTDDDHFQDILFDKKNNRFFYYAQFINKGDGKKEFAEIAQTMQNCLGSSWSVTLKNVGYNGPTHIFRSADSSLVINLFNDGGVICISCYATTKK